LGIITDDRMRIVHLLLYLIIVEKFDKRVAALAISVNMLSEKYFLGFDLGTSGARISVIALSKDPSTAFVEIHSDSLLYKNSYDDPQSWTETVHKLLVNTPKSILGKTQAICVSGTSASCLIVDTITRTVSRQPKMYDYDIVLKDEHSKNIMNDIENFAPPNHTVRSPTSTLAKLLHYHSTSPLSSSSKLLHQADYITSTLLSSQSTLESYTSISDWHNVLKLGYDIRNLEWPLWIRLCLEHFSIPFTVLPNKVVSPGQVIGTIDSNVSKLYGIHRDCLLVGGTTDSNAAFFAASSDAIGSFPSSSSMAGIAVTSLGSTLAIKMTSTAFIEDSKRGVYSHRFPSSFSSSNIASDSESLWLVGGASNVGCAILRQEQYSNQELDECSQLINPMIDCAYDYYPLTKQGERFPVADSLKLPIMDPKPKQNNRVEYLHAILQGIAKVECQGYKALGDLGAIPSFPSTIWTCGGGSKNPMWTKMRQRLLVKQRKDLSLVVGDTNEALLELPVRRALQSEASFGAAVIAASTFHYEIAGV